MSMTIDAQEAVLRQLAKAYDELAEIEQELVGDGYYEDAEVAHDQALRVLAAYNAEARPENRRAISATFYERPPWSTW